jgi:hypothetical protein
MSSDAEQVVELPETRNPRGSKRGRRIDGAPPRRRVQRDGGTPADVGFERQLLNECGAMLRYASTRGLEIPPKAAYTVRELDTKRAKAGDAWEPDPDDSADLAAAHWLLSRLVDPATPKSITLVNQQSPRSSWLGLFGAVRVVRLMMVLAIAFLVLFLLLLPYVGKDPAGEIAGDSWARGIIGAFYIVVAAGLGVLFSQLFRINRQISRGQYDPDEDSVHITTVVLGLIAGVILAMLLPDVLQGNDATADFSPALLALIGGFSAPAVYGVVSRLVDAVGTLVGGDPRDQAATEVQEAVTRVRLTSEQDRRRMAGRAYRVGDAALRALKTDDDAKRPQVTHDLEDEIRDMMNDLVPEMGSDPHRAAATRSEAGAASQAERPS